MTAEMAEMKQNILNDLREGKENRRIVTEICKKYHLLFETFMDVFGRTEEYRAFLRCQTAIAAKGNKVETERDRRAIKSRQSMSGVWWTDERKLQAVEIYNTGSSCERVALKMNRSTADVTRKIRELRESGEYTIRIPRRPGKHKKNNRATA